MYIDEDEILAWAKDEHMLPAVRLLQGMFDGKYFTYGFPWMIPGGAAGRAWVDFLAIPEHVDLLEDEDEAAALMLVASLASVRVPFDITESLVAMSPSDCELVLAAIAHAAAALKPGSTPIYAWPDA